MVKPGWMTMKPGIKITSNNACVTYGTQRAVQPVPEGQGVDFLVIFLAALCKTTSEAEDSTFTVRRHGKPCYGGFLHVGRTHGDVSFGSASMTPGGRAAHHARVMGLKKAGDFLKQACASEKSEGAQPPPHLST